MWIISNSEKATATVYMHQDKTPLTGMTLVTWYTSYLYWLYFCESVLLSRILWVPGICNMEVNQNDGSKFCQQFDVQKVTAWNGHLTWFTEVKNQGILLRDSMWTERRLIGNNVWWTGYELPNWHGCILNFQASGTKISYIAIEFYKNTNALLMSCFL